MKNLARDRRKLAEIFSVEGYGKRGGLFAAAPLAHCAGQRTMDQSSGSEPTCQLVPTFS